jgi:CheY-like chemotaxis protein
MTPSDRSNGSGKPYRSDLGFALPSPGEKTEIIELMDSVVLVVDDDPSFLAIAARVLIEMGAQSVLTAEDTIAAINEAQAGRPTAVLVDVGLPDREGIELALELAALPWSPRVVLTSTDPDAGRLLDGIETAIPFVPKEELANGVLRRLLVGD